MDTSTLREVMPVAVDSLGRRCGPRRRWPAADKRRIVEETLRPGVSVAEVARHYALNANLLFGWRRLYQQGLLDGASEPASARLVPVEVGAAEATPPSAAVTAPRGSIEIELPNARVRVTGEVTADQLGAVLAALGRCR